MCRGAVFHEAAIKARCQRGRCGRVRVPAVTLRVRGMLRGMPHGCAETPGGSSKMQSWQDNLGAGRVCPGSAGGCLGSRRQLQVFGSLEHKVLHDGESGQDRQQGLAPKPRFFGGRCGLCMEQLAADCSAQGAPRSGVSRESPALRGHRAWGGCRPGPLGSAVRQAQGRWVVVVGQHSPPPFLPC